MPRNAPASASAAERPHAAPTVAAFCWPVPVAVADVEVEVGDVAVELFPDEDTEEDEDEKGTENEVDGREVGKVMDVLVDAKAQNCSAMDSAEDRSVQFCVVLQPTSEDAKRVALYVCADLWGHS